MLRTDLYNENDNDWANDIKSDPIHISQAKSGRKGYFCMGCTKEMQAVKRKDTRYQSYFRHHVDNVEHSKSECVHSSREYREKLAYNYFMRVKQIKVPAVYKYPPKGEEGNPVLLEEVKTITAHRVDREVTFFEDENCKIHWGKNTKVDERYLMLRPDAIFYDENDKPILFIEFVITHKPDLDKLNKLQRLGIDTVQIIVPKLPEPELEKSISQASKVKWTYNENESNTEYLPISNASREGVPFIDEEQRKLFEESFKCRSAQIGNLIRSIKRCLGSESYHRVERLFEQEISRIENATRERRARLDEIQAGIEDEISSEFRDRREELEKEEEGFREYSEDLDERYHNKANTLREEQRSIDREIELRLRTGQSEEGIRREFQQLEADFRDGINIITRGELLEEKEIKREQADIEREKARVDITISKDTAFKNDYRGVEEGLRIEFKQLEDSERENLERETTDLHSKITGIKEARVEFENGVRSEIEGRYNQIAERVNNRDVRGRDELSDRIKTILEIRGYLDSYQRNIERINEAKRIIEERFYKNWD